MMNRNGLFLAYTNHLRSGGGGVQKCTHEFIRVLGAAGVELEILAVDPDRRSSTRLLRRFRSSRYWRPMSRACLCKLRDAMPRFDYVFLNQVALVGAIDDFNLGSKAPLLVMLSHGCEITDLLHLARLAQILPLNTRDIWPSKRFALATTLVDEIKGRTQVHGVISISPFDAEMEAWLGSPSTTWIPRIIEPCPLRRAPVCGRFGFVGTLDHPPNLEGLVNVLDSLLERNLHRLAIRVVGGPERQGTWLASKYSSVEYLGPLDDHALQVEAGTWSAFLHPIFCLARGCSTKLATALSWQVPIITTALGRRGYTWRDGSMIEVSNPDEFVDAMYRFEEKNFANTAHRDILAISESCPTLDEVGSKVGTFLNSIRVQYAKP